MAAAYDPRGEARLFQGAVLVSVALAGVERAEAACEVAFEGAEDVAWCDYGGGREEEEEEEEVLIRV